MVKQKECFRLWLHRTTLSMFPILMVVNLVYGKSERNPAVNALPDNVFSRKSVPSSWFYKWDQQGPSISWPEWKAEGDIHLQFMPTQVYVRDGHNNPNPSCLYWVEKITPRQFEAISAYLQSPLGKKWQRAQNDYYASGPDQKMEGGLIMPFVNNWEKYSPDELNQDFWAKLYCNINLILMDVNDHMPKGMAGLKGPSEDFVIKKRMVFIVDDIDVRPALVPKAPPR